MTSRNSPRHDSLSADALPARITPKELAPLCKRIKRVIHRVRSNQLRDYYELGSLVGNGFAPLLERHHKYHNRTLYKEYMRQLTKALQGEGYDVSDEFLKDCITFTQSITPEEREEIAETRNCTFSHVMVLLAVTDRQQRHAYLRRIADERLRAADLAREVRKLCGSPKATASRRPRMPGDLDEAIPYLADSLKKIRKLFGDSWAGPVFDVADQLQDAPLAAWTEGFRESVRNIVDALKALAADSTTAASRLEVQLQCIDSSITANLRNPEAR